jgi:hypothetical protein
VGYGARALHFGFVTNAGNHGVPLGSVRDLTGHIRIAA